MLVVLKKAVAALMLPPAGLFMVALLGWLAWRRGARRTGVALTWIALVTLVLLCLPATAALLTWLLYDGSRYDPALAAQAQAIVVLGGGLRVAPEYGGDTLARLTLERVRYAARLAKETGLPVLVTGGRLFTLRSEGEVMRAALEREFGVPVRWVESCARNTHENARFTARMLRPQRIERVLLVSHGVDARRARREFAGAGLEAIGAPTEVPSWGVDSAFDLVPSAVALRDSSLAMYEALANLALSLGLNRAGSAPDPECADPR